MVAPGLDQPDTMMLEPDLLVLSIIGQLISPFGPESASQDSFSVTPSSFKSIPKASPFIPLL